MGITALVMGILAVFYCGFPLVLAIADNMGNFGLEDFSGMVAFPLLAIIFGGCAIGKKYTNGISLSGLLLGILGLLAYAAFMIVYFLC